MPFNETSYDTVAAMRGIARSSAELKEKNVTIHVLSFITIT
jgi:hypothetical protein